MCMCLVYMQNVTTNVFWLDIFGFTYQLEQKMPRQISNSESFSVFLVFTGFFFGIFFFINTNSIE